MIYKINGLSIDSKYAAKSEKQKGKILTSIIKKIIFKNKYVLDYGCGLLRYTFEMAKISKSVFAVDSEEQIIRVKSNFKLLTKLSRYKNIKLYSINERFHRKNFDYIFLNNVLSSIPSIKERKKILLRIKKFMGFNTKLIISNQYKNSFYSKNNKNSKKYLDGYLNNIKNKKANFYGLIDRENILDLLSNSGIKVIDSIYFGETNITICEIE